MGKRGSWWHDNMGRTISRLFSSVAFSRVHVYVAVEYKHWFVSRQQATFECGLWMGSSHREAIYCLVNYLFGLTTKKSSKRRIVVLWSLRKGTVMHIGALRAVIAPTCSNSTNENSVGVQIADSISHKNTQSFVAVYIFSMISRSVLINIRQRGFIGIGDIFLFVWLYDWVMGKS